MKFYPEDYDVQVVVKFTDLNGAVITPTAVTAVLWDEQDEVVVDFGSLPFDAADGEKAIIIPAAFNVLADGQLSAGRVLRIQLDTTAGPIRRSFTYRVEGEFRLSVMENTFLTYEAAELMARDQVNTTGWNTASEDKRHAALIEAYNRLTNIPMRFAHRDAEGRLLLTEESVIPRDTWIELDAEDFRQFPTHFKKALRQAQFTEANELLQGDTITSKHRAGIISETIGESSMTLRAGRVDYGVSTQTMAHLAGYIHFNIRIARS